MTRMQGPESTDAWIKGQGGGGRGMGLPAYGAGGLRPIWILGITGDLTHDFTSELNLTGPGLSLNWEAGHLTHKPLLFCFTQDVGDGGKKKEV
jgi:hypothetical protein